VAGCYRSIGAEGIQARDADSVCGAYAPGFADGYAAVAVCQAVLSAAEHGRAIAIESVPVGSM
jgi:hypothetical protein